MPSLPSSRPIIVTILFLVALLLVSVVIGGCGAATTEAAAPAYTPEELAYFAEIAFGAEYGHRDEHIRKWTSDVRLRVSGVPAEEDLAVLRGVVDELNALIDEVRVELVDGDDAAPNAEVRFVTQDELDVRVGRACHCTGMAVTVADGRRYIRSAEVLILAAGTPAARAHAIREEVTQMLGLMVDSHAYPYSIFSQGPEAVTEYAGIDRKVIEMLYRPEVRPGMTRAEAVHALSGSLR